MPIGYTESAKIWKLWDFSMQRALRSADIIFVEEENAITDTLGNRESLQGLLLNDESSEPSAASSETRSSAIELEHHELPRQMNSDLHHLTNSDAYLALHAHVAHYLDGSG